MEQGFLPGRGGQGTPNFQKQTNLPSDQTNILQKKLSKMQWKRFNPDSLENLE